MIEVYPALYVGDGKDYDMLPHSDDKWLVLQAARDPWHRRALGYAGPSAPQKHPEYLIAMRDHRMILNMVDAESARYFDQVQIDQALKFINDGRKNANVLVHCNEGRSRAPTLAMLYLRRYTDQLPDDFAQAEQEFIADFYRGYRPGMGMRAFAKSKWDYYKRKV